MELAAVAPLAFAVGVLFGLGLSSRYRIVRVIPPRGGAVQTIETPPRPEPDPDEPQPPQEPEPRPPRED